MMNYDDKLYNFVRNTFYIYSLTLLLLLLLPIVVSVSFILSDGWTQAFVVIALIMYAPFLCILILLFVGLIYIFIDIKKYLKTSGKSIVNKKKLYIELAVMIISIFLFLGLCSLYLYIRLHA